MSELDKEALIDEITREYKVRRLVVKDILERTNYDYERAKNCIKLLLAPREKEVKEAPKPKQAEVIVPENIKNVIDKANVAKRWLLFIIYKEKQELDYIMDLLNERFTYLSVDESSEDGSFIKSKYLISEFPSFVVIDPVDMKEEKKGMIKDLENLREILSNLLEMNPKYGLPIEDDKSDDESPLVPIKIQTYEKKNVVIKIHEGDKIRKLYKIVANIICRPMDSFSLTSALPYKHLMEMNNTIKDEKLANSVVCVE